MPVHLQRSSHLPANARFLERSQGVQRGLLRCGIGVDLWDSMKYDSVIKVAFPFRAIKKKGSSFHGNI